MRQVVVGFRRGLDHLLAPFFRFVDQARRDVAQLVLHALRRLVPVDRLHLDQIDDALELLFRADRDLDRYRIALQPRLDVVVRLEEFGALTVHLVDERQPRHFVLVRLTPDGLRLRLHAGDRVVHHAGTVEHAHRALDFDREVDVARRVDDVDSMLGMVVLHPLPEAGRRGRRDRYAALALLLHPVHDGRAVVDLADLVRHAGVEKDALGGRGLTGINVGTDADIPIALDGCVSCHVFSMPECLRGIATRVRRRWFMLSV